MTNLEYMVSIGADYDDRLCALAHISKYKCNCGIKECRNCEFDKNNELCVQILLEEHKEPIRLTQWEKDMIEIRNENDVNFDNPLCCNEYFSNLKNKGYFKSVDLSKTAKEILENCEVVEND